MILAAGLGTRLRPLTNMLAKPALPVRGRPVIGLLLEYLHSQGIREVIINLHYLPQTIRSAVEADCPADLEVSWSAEPEPLGTGGGIRLASTFLAEAAESVVLAGDMLFDVDLADLLAQHRERGFDTSLILRDDPRARDFGTIELGAGGQVRRIGKRIVQGVEPGGAASTVRGDDEVAPFEPNAGLFTGVRIFSRRAFEVLPDQNVFEDLREWLIPSAEAKRIRFGGLFADPTASVWEPVGTPSEYLHMNLKPPSLPSLGGDASRWMGSVRVLGDDGDVVAARDAEIGPGSKLERAVVWPGEKVPAGFQGADGVFASGRFHECDPRAAGSGQPH